MLDSGFRSPGFRIPQAKISWIPESGFPYVGRTRGSSCKGFDWEKFGVLDWWSLTKGGHTWRFDCTEKNGTIRNYSCRGFFFLKCHTDFVNDQKSERISGAFRY